MTTVEDEDTPANRIIDQWIGKMYGSDRQVLVTQYGDGSMTVAWRHDPYCRWSPWVELRRA